MGKKGKSAAARASPSPATAERAGDVMTSSTTPATPVPGRLDPNQARLAADALLQHVSAPRSGSSPGKKGSKEQLFGPGAEPINLVVALRRVPERMRVKPFRVAVPHDLFTEESEVCLIVKDPQRTYKDLLAEENARVDARNANGDRSSESDSESDSGSDSDGVAQTRARRIPVTQVIGLQKLRDNYKTFEAKRTLSSGFDLFLADDRILPLLPKLLGNAFFEKKKQPVPVNVTKATSWAKNVRKAIYGATYMHQNAGACTMVKVGHSAMTGEQLAENIVAAASGVAANTPKKWKGIQALHIKTSSSISLPIFSNAIAVEVNKSGVASSAARAAALPTSDETEPAKHAAKNAGTKKGNSKKGNNKKGNKSGGKSGDNTAHESTERIRATNPSSAKKGTKRSSSAAAHDRKAERSPKNRRT